MSGRIGLYVQQKNGTTRISEVRNCFADLYELKIMALGEVFLGSFLGAIMKSSISPDMVKFLREERFEKKINRWGRTLKIIDALLQDAEEKQLTDRAVRMWLDDLEALAYDAEDMLEEFEYEAIDRKAKMEQLQSCIFLKYVPAVLCSWTPDVIKFRFRMWRKVNHITREFDRLCALKGQLGLRDITGRASSSAPQRPPTSGHQTETTVYGRDADKKKILDMVRNEAAEHNLFTISIVGMGGLGKTTLAQEVFTAVKNEFDVTVWVCVSDGEFDVIKISKSILENITSSSLPNELPTLHDKIAENVNGKKLLIVFDDVWRDDYGRWKTVLSPLRASAAGSRIIITTRSEVVASTLKSDRIHILDLLHLEDCWSIILMNVKHKTINIHPDKKLIKEKVFARTKGLPLAAATLGGILYSEHIDTWLKILDNKLWDFSEQRDKQIPAALKLSYYHLPYYLKRCFSFCSLFPKDHPFRREELVYLWVAAGLIPPSTQEEELEELGCRCFSHLLKRCLFQPSSGNEVETFSMHDLVHDLAIWAFGERDLRSDGILTADMQSEGSKKARYFAYVPTDYDDEKRFEPFQNVKGLKGRARAFLPIPQYPIYKRNNIADSVIFELLPKLKRLRILSLQEYSVSRIPTLLGCLKHLTYVNFSGTSIQSLPESVSVLYNLQFLILRHCSELKNLPLNFKYLLKLCHFDLESCFLIKEMPLGMKDLENLQNLSHFIVGEDGKGSNIKDLKDLKKLRGKLRITRLNNMIKYGEADQILKDKEHLKELSLEWKSTSEGVKEKYVDIKVLDMLQPHENLQKLAIKGYSSSKFSSWLGAASYSHMKVLELNDCEKCESLPSLGVLSSLEELTIKRMGSLERLCTEFYGESVKSFNSLKLLCLEDLPILTEWVSVEGNEYGAPFLCLQTLSLVDCPQLFGSLPQHLVALEDLTIRRCNQLVVSFSSIPSKLSKIVIDGCKTIKCDNSEELKSIKYLELSDIAEYSYEVMHEYFGKAVLEQVEEEKGITITSDEICPQVPRVRELHNLKFLGELFISNISNMVSILEVCSLPNLRIFRIEHCNALISLPEEMRTGNECLESVNISCCSSIQFIVSGHLPPSLKTLDIRRCEKLERLWDDRGAESCSSSQLEALNAKSCSSLTSLSSIIQFPSSLKELCFVNCKGLTKLNQSGELPASLITLEFDNCPKLRTIAWDGLLQNNLHNLSDLRELTIIGCKSMENLSMEGSTTNTHLTRLWIWNCEQLKALPNGLGGIHSLEEVWIKRCPNISSFNPDEVFPTHIKSLSIDGNCKNVYRSLVEWGLQNLSSLTSLTLWDIDVESFPHAELEVELPSSLTQLRIYGCEKLKKLLGLRQDISLRSLELWECSDLVSFGDDGLPSSLQTLKIVDCPKLEVECRRNGGREWLKISNIPKVFINYKPIFVSEEEEGYQKKINKWRMQIKRSN